MTEVALQFDRTVPRDDIGFEVLNQYLQFGAQTRSFEEIQKILSWVYVVLNKANDAQGRLTRSRIAAMQDVTHCRNLPEEGIIYFVSFHWDFAGSLKRHTRSMRQLVVSYRSTPRGIMYMCSPSKTDSTLLFPAHFFDRFTERALDDEASRVKAVGKFLWFLLQRKTNRRYVNADGAVTLFCDEGAALGHKRIVTNREGTDEVPVYYFKTFISRDMFTRDQKFTEAYKAEAMDPIRYSKEKP